MRDHSVVEVEEQLKKKFPDLSALLCRINDVNVKQSDPNLEKFKEQIIKDVAKRYTIDSLKDTPIFRAYRDFFWKIGIDPTKTRPAAEALIRRIIIGTPIPRVNTLVDAYNLASIETGVSIAAFDADKLNGKLLMRQAISSEVFFGIGMDKQRLLQGEEVIIQDNEKIIAIYPYRDAENTKIIYSTNNIELMICGVPGISEQQLLNALQVTTNYITKFCDGILT